MTVTNLHSMTLVEASVILTAIGYRTDWTVEQLRAATPPDLRKNVALALRITAAADMAEANGLEVKQHG